MGLIATSFLGYVRLTRDSSFYYHFRVILAGTQIVKTNGEGRIVMI